jgi:beta-1,4-mannosyl-glycoprotein beta-1,4-N-acetylglucosaminyltransferase
MIIDCFPFFNELDILEIRLNILNDFVDKFILVEASKTQSKLDKPFYFEENKKRFDKFLDKIIHIKVTDYPDQSGWEMENYQRNCILKGLNNIELSTDDIIGISDVDEIWSPNCMDLVKSNIKYNNIISIDMRYLVFFLNLETVNKRWIGSVFTTAKLLEKYSPQHLRNIKDHVYNLNDMGWHFGYQGGKEKVYEKYLSCIEPLDKSKLPNKEKFFQEFNNRIKDNGSFIFSDNLSDHNIKLNKFDTSQLPDFIVQNLSSYHHMILE